MAKEDDNFKDAQEEEDELDAEAKAKEKSMFCQPLPKAYFNFIKRERVFWIILNILMVILQLAMAIMADLVVTGRIGTVKDNTSGSTT